VTAAAIQDVVKMLGEGTPGAEVGRREAIAAAALMVECARVSPEYEPGERRAIATGVRKLFDLPPEIAEMFVEIAEERADDGWQPAIFTSAIKQGFDPEMRELLVRLLCDVAYADGVFHLREAAFIRRIAQDLGVSEDAIRVPEVRVSTSG
jgi:uncharacterized tellurite resistance protein B-like protein